MLEKHVFRKKNFDFMKMIIVADLLPKSLLSGTIRKIRSLQRGP